MRIFYKKRGTDTAIDITDLAVSVRSSWSTQDGKLLGNTPSLMFDIDLNNVSGALSKCADGAFFIDTNEVDSTGTPIQEFLVQEAPEKYTSKISLTLYDYMIKLNQPYRSTFQYTKEDSPTIAQQLDEIATLSGITIDKTGLPQTILERKAGWIDTTIVMRNYVSWIAELGGKNAFIDQNNRLVFRGILMVNHGIDCASDFEKTDLITISRVAYDDGINLIASGDDSGKTIYIDANNSYCNDQSYTNAILAMYGGQSFYGVSGLKTIGKDGVCLGDTVTYDGIKCIVLSIKRDYVGQESAFELDGEVALKNADTVVTKVSDKVKIRRLQVQVDQTSNQLSIISKDLEDSKGGIAELKVASSAVEATVSKLASETDGVKADLKTFQEQTAEGFSQTVSKAEYDGAISGIQKNFDLKGLRIHRTLNGESSKKEAILNDEELIFTRSDGSNAVRINEHESYFGKWLTVASHRFEVYPIVEWDTESIGGINPNGSTVNGTGLFYSNESEGAN